MKRHQTYKKLDAPLVEKIILQWEAANEGVHAFGQRMRDEIGVAKWTTIGLIGAWNYAFSENVPDSYSADIARWLPELTSIARYYRISGRHWTLGDVPESSPILAAAPPESWTSTLDKGPMEVYYDTRDGHVVKLPVDDDEEVVSSSWAEKLRLMLVAQADLKDDEAKTLREDADALRRAAHILQSETLHLRIGKL